jgi:hypothetical protein
MTFSIVVQKIVWLRNFLNHLDFCENKADLVLVHNDSQAIIVYTKDPKHHSKIKYIDTNYNFIRNIISKKQVCMQYISTHKMITYPFTEVIHRDVFIDHVKSLGYANYNCTYA